MTTRSRIRAAIGAAAAGAAVTAVAALAGCAPATGQFPRSLPALPAPPDPHAAMAYLRTHPVPARPGMNAGIVAADGEQLFTCPSPGATTLTAWTRHSGEAVGGPGTCAAWHLSVITRSGRTLTVACGNAPRARTCRLLGSTRTVEDLMGLSPGDLVYFPSGRTVTGTGSILVIRRGAVPPR